MKRKHASIGFCIVAGIFVAALLIRPSQKIVLKYGQYTHPGFGGDAVIIIKEETFPIKLSNNLIEFILV